MQRIFVEARKVGTTCYPIPCLLTDTWDVEFGWICLSCSINFLKGLHPVPLTNVQTKAEPASRNDWHFIKMVTTSWVKKAALLKWGITKDHCGIRFFFFLTLWNMNAVESHSILMPEQADCWSDSLCLFAWLCLQLLGCSQNLLVDVVWKPMQEQQ